MATVTAMIQIGTAHQNHSGICPTHQMFLSENSRPAWTLYQIHSDEPMAVWIPTVENMLEDGILMACLLTIKDPALVSAAAAFRGDYLKRAELYDDINAKNRRNLYELSRRVGVEHKLVISVLEGCSFTNQLAILGQYLIGVEVCQSIYSREYSAWTNSVNETGTLPEIRQLRK